MGCLPPFSTGDWDFLTIHRTIECGNNNLEKECGNCTRLVGMWESHFNFFPGGICRFQYFVYIIARHVFDFLEYSTTFKTLRISARHHGLGRQIFKIFGHHEASFFKGLGIRTWVWLKATIRLRLRDFWLRASAPSTMCVFYQDSLAFCTHCKILPYPDNINTSWKGHQGILEI